MGNYTKISIKQDFHETYSKETGTLLHKVVVDEVKYKEKQGRTQGMRLTQWTKLSDTMANVISSNLEARMFSYMINNNTKKGEVKLKGKSVTIGIQDIANIFNTTRKTVSKFIKKCIDFGLIKKNKRALVLNPYIVVPHAISNDELFILQTFWDSNFTYDIRQELADAELEYLKSVNNNKPIDMELQRISNEK